ncbi:hypothetical protein AAFF_G00145530 [Aldrovandia affinis]|uniref:SOGA coiled-coil domain-containing protein n=1 Tax=Aldrovandia affinis TaxID=143900 RepID=A0AAD7WWL8_9TELE|nr:hypothetical protein AAFF_G00145530 [Aldrovandia affinis]
MDSEHGSSVTQQQPPQCPHQPVAQQHQASDQRHVHRPSTPAKPKGVLAASLAKIKASSSATNLSGKPGATQLGNRMSPCTQGKGNRDMKSDKGKHSGKAMPPVSIPQKRRSKSSGLRKLSEPSYASDDLTEDSGCAPDKMSPSDSSSEISDCTSEENKFYATSSDTECHSRGEGADGVRSREDHGSAVPPDMGGRGDQHVKTSVDKEEIPASDERSFASTDSRLNFRASFTFSDLQEEFMNGMQDEFVREIEELRSENDYLKDELEELQSEMLEMRDEYLEEDVYQLQVLRQQLDQANKSCRILQYRLRKAERRGLRAAQTGQLDGELVSALEQDLKVAKDVSIRLHSELKVVERKRAGLEQENTDLRERLQELEVTSQVLQAEMDKTRENSLKRRGSRSSCKPEKKLSPQEDSSDLRCQLHFAKEESTLMCRKLAKLARESESMAEELARFRSLYGGVEGSVDPTPGHAHAHGHEMEIRVHLRLVEEEANLLSRRIVELEVENRGLRAEMEEKKYPELPEEPGGAGGSEEVEPRRQVEMVEEEREGEPHQRPLLEAEQGHCRAMTGPGEESHALLHHLDSGVESRGEGESIDREDGALEGRGSEGGGGHSQPAHGGLSLDAGPDYPALLNIRDQARLLNSAIYLLTASDSAHLPSPARHMTCPAEQWVLGKDTLDRRLEDLQAQLLAFMEGVEVQFGDTPPSLLARAPPLPPPCTLDGRDSKNSVELKRSHSQEEEGAGQGCDEDMAACRQGVEETDTGEVNSVNTLYLWMEEEGLAAHQGDRKTHMAGEDPFPLENHKHAPPLENHMEVWGVSTLVELKGALRQLTAEMLEERQEFTNAKTVWEAERTELLSQITQSLLDGVSEKDSYTETEDTEIQRMRPLPSPLYTKDQSGPQITWRCLEGADPYRTWSGPTSTRANPVQRSHTAPERSGLRIYFSPPAARRAHDRGEGTYPPSNRGWPRGLPPLDEAGMAANLSDDMKEMTHSVRRGRGRGRADAACQTVGGVAGMGGVASVGLQTEELPGSARSPRRHISSSLERVPARPHCGSPKLQCRVSTPSSHPSSCSSSTLSSSTTFSTSSFASSSCISRTEGPTGATLWRMRGQNRSVPPRSTPPPRCTPPRAGTLLSGRSAGLFRVVERGVATETSLRDGGGKPSGGAGGVHRYGLVQEFLRSVCGRGQAPAAGGRGRGGAGGRGKPERAAPRVAVPAGSDSVTRIVNKRLLSHSQREEPGQPGGTLREKEKSRSNNNASEDAACDCNSRSLTSCFARPSRSGARHAPGQCRLRSRESCQTTEGKGQLASE